MKYFIDTEFLEGTQKVRIPLTNISLWNTKETIDLISIGIICEDERELYLISKDFNIKEAWNRYDLQFNKHFPIGPEYNKVYWIRENVLKPIYEDLIKKEFKEDILAYNDFPFSYGSMVYLINKYGYTRKEIAKKILDYTKELPNGIYYQSQDPKPEFYGYYCDYDWVVFCWIFGKMIDLPEGFPMYCIDLKQQLDHVIMTRYKDALNVLGFNNVLDRLKKHKLYPKQTNEHNALADAKWSLKLHDFINYDIRFEKYV